MKVAGATAIGNLIEAHIDGNDKKFYVWANFIADAYEDNGDLNAAKLIRNRINKIESEKAVLDKPLLNTSSSVLQETCDSCQYYPNGIPCSDCEGYSNFFASP